jgi:hypothetical protein
MYYTGLDPRTMENVYVATNPHEKAMQRALIQYRNPKNYDLVYEALMKEGRQDLIGFDKKCLIKPRRMSPDKIADGKVDYRKVPTGKSKTSSKNNHSGKKKTIRNVHKKK